MAQGGEPVDSGRRAALKGAVRAACGAALLPLLLSIPARSRSNAEVALRPPGALPEADFLAACVRCGLCVRDCPYGTLKLAEAGDGVPLGTPFFNARLVPCEMCEDIPCVPACPTGALDHALTDINAARMGLAVLLDHETCLNWLGLRCDVCYRVCPRIDEAITLETQHNARTGKHAQFLPTVHSEHCTGCGKCEKSCVLEKAAIKVLPLSEAKGELGQHYRLGWKEKDKAGGHSLVGDDLITLPARGVEDTPALSTIPGLNGSETGGTGGGAAP